MAATSKVSFLFILLALVVGARCARLSWGVESRTNRVDRKVAWSKLGCIAIINAEGTGVETRHLACNPSDGRWLLSPAYPITGVTQMHEGQKLQHVTWSSHGADLAVVDVLGRLSFYTVNLAINALSLVTVVPPDHDDDLNALVGFWWLPAERPCSLHLAVRAEEGFKYQSPTSRPFGPFHPLLNKAAALGVTRNGFVCGSEHKFAEAGLTRIG